MQREVKSCYIIVVNGVDECGRAALHNPLYDFNDEILGGRICVIGKRLWNSSQLSNHRWEKCTGKTSDMPMSQYLRVWLVSSCICVQTHLSNVVELELQWTLSCVIKHDLLCMLLVNSLLVNIQIPVGDFCPEPSQLALRSTEVPQNVPAPLVTQIEYTIFAILELMIC